MRRPGLSQRVAITLSRAAHHGKYWRRRGALERQRLSGYRFAHGPHGGWRACRVLSFSSAAYRGLRQCPLSRGPLRRRLFLFPCHPRADLRRLCQGAQAQTRRLEESGIELAREERCSPTTFRRRIRSREVHPVLDDLAARLHYLASTMAYVGERITSKYIKGQLDAA